MEELHENLKKGQHEKISKLEEENRRLLLALDESADKTKIQEKTIAALRAEVENLRAVLAATQKKCSEAEKEAKSAKETQNRDDELVTLMDKKRKLEEQLKWKKEQFKHLEDAHEKLKEQCKASKGEWEKERSSLLEEVSVLETKITAQRKEIEGLKIQLGNGKLALVHEENRRKNSETQLSEARAQLESLSDQCWEAKSRCQCSSFQINEEMTDLRNSLRAEETQRKEFEYRVKKLEAENRDLLNSLRDLQEAHIPKAVATPPSAVSKLKNKLRSLEQTHRDCGMNLKLKEVEWNSKFEKVKKELDEYKFQARIKESSMKDLREELHDCHSALTELKMQNEELSLMLQLLKSDLPGNAEMLMRGTDEYKAAGVERQGMVTELEKYKRLLDECSKEKINLERQAGEKERELRDELKEVRDELERLDAEFTESTHRQCELEFELHVCRLASEQLKTKLIESKEMRREIEASLMEQAEVEGDLKLQMDGLEVKLAEKDKKISDLQRLVGDDQPNYEMKEDETSENLNQIISPSVVKASGILTHDDERLPFREVN